MTAEGRAFGGGQKHGVHGPTVRTTSSRTQGPLSKTLSLSDDDVNQKTKKPWFVGIAPIPPAGTIRSKALVNLLSKWGTPKKLSEQAYGLLPLSLKDLVMVIFFR